MKDWIDISVLIKPGMMTWPGQPAVEVSKLLSIKNGDLSNLSKLSLSVHTGTHMDAPLHFIPDGSGINTLQIDTVVGPARVIDIQDKESIKVEELEPADIRPGQRILFKTNNSSVRWDKLPFNPSFVYLSTEGAEYLAERNVACVGIDYPSIAGYKNNEAAVHQSLMKAGIWIIEGLNLNQAKEGNYQMICLPINIDGCDGAPARVIIRGLED